MPGEKPSSIFTKLADSVEADKGINPHFSPMWVEIGKRDEIQCRILLRRMFLDGPSSAEAQGERERRSILFRM